MKKTELEKERRERFLTRLIKESIINILAEQEPQQSAVPPSPVPPAPETNAPEQPIEEPVEEFTVDAMVDKLNVIRGGRSFSDPEVYGRMVTYFNNLPEEEKNSINKYLTDLGSVIIDATEEQVGQNLPKTSVQAQQPPPPTQQPQASSTSPSMPVTPSNIGY